MAPRAGALSALRRKAGGILYTLTYNPRKTPNRINRTGATMSTAKLANESEGVVMSHSRRLALHLALVALGARLPAQLTVSTIRGTATDPSGAAVVGVSITLVNLGTNIQRVVVSNENGDFEIPDLQRGTYRLTASHTGFKSW